MEVIQDRFQRQPLLLNFQCRVLCTYSTIKFDIKTFYIFFAQYMYAFCVDLGEHSGCFVTRCCLSVFIVQYEMNIKYMSG